MRSSSPPKTITILGELTQETLGDFYGAFLAADSKKGVTSIVISSGGGSVDVGIAMYELIRTSKYPVHTVGVGEIASMAVLVLLAGDKRTVTQGSTLLLHDGSVSMSGSLMKAKAAMDETMRQHQRYCEQVAARTRLPLAEVLEMASGETYLTADEAKAKGFVHAVRKYR